MEEDWDFFRLFPIIPDLLRLLPSQPANNPKPKSQKQPKTNPSKMQMQLFFYHTTTLLKPPDIQCSISPPQPFALNSLFSTFSNTSYKLNHFKEKIIVHPSGIQA
jgi:hypothetical protein